MDRSPALQDEHQSATASIKGEPAGSERSSASRSAEYDFSFAWPALRAQLRTRPPLQRSKEAGAAER